MKPFSFLNLASLLLLSITAISCASRRTGQIKTNDSQAAIEIVNSNESDIRQAVIETFLINGYERESSYGLTFMKKGDIARQLEYASFMGGAAMMRVRIRIEPLSSKSFLVKANAFTVTHQDSTFGANERKVRGLRKGHYRNLLEEVQERLQPRY